MAQPPLDLQWRAAVTADDLRALTAADDDGPDPDRWERVRHHVLGWVTARSAAGTLIGFVAVAWDGDGHAFLLDTATHPDHRRRGVATAVVALATEQARLAGCRWLHVDYVEDLRAFYETACGFRPTAAGVLRLDPQPG